MVPAPKSIQSDENQANPFTTAKLGGGLDTAAAFGARQALDSARADKQSMERSLSLPAVLPPAGATAASARTLGSTGVAPDEAALLQAVRQLPELTTSLPDTDTRTAKQAARDNMMSSVVKVMCTIKQPNFSLPWQRKQQWQSKSSGCVVDLDRRWLLTNAHCVYYATQVQVKKCGCDTKYVAKVLAVGTECDMALLTVESDAFWQGIAAVRWGGLPQLQDSVVVVGYPVGGDSVSFTSGVVSRVEVIEYSLGAAQLLGVQIDAAINPGNSGGPVFVQQGGQGRSCVCVGIAFEGMSGTDIENVGYIVPTPIVHHFLDDFKHNGHFMGFPSLGVAWQEMESSVLRQAHKMEADHKGVLVRGINPTAPAHAQLQLNDIIMFFDGVAVSNDGTVPFREMERVSLQWLAATKFVGDTCTLGLLRDGQPLSITLKLNVPSTLLPAHNSNRSPAFLVVAGLVFTPASIPYLESEFYGSLTYAPTHLKTEEHRFPKLPGHEVVILSQVLACDATLGYDDLKQLKVLRVNGAAPKNLAHLAELVLSCKGQYVWFELLGRVGTPVIVLEMHNLVEQTRAALERNDVPHAISADLQAKIPHLQ